jgi:hypothetical protein
MDAPSYDAIVRSLTQGWNDAWLRRGVIGLLGLVILLQTGRAAWARQARVLSLLLWAAIGVTLAALALFPVPVLTSVMGVEYFARVRFIMGAVSLLVVVITIEAVRRGHLQERYALLWMLTGVFMLAIVAVPGSLALFRAITGMEYAAALAAVAFIFLVLVSFHFSIALSALHARLARLTQQLAIMEANQRAENPQKNAPPAELKP